MNAPSKGSRFATAGGPSCPSSGPCPWAPGSAELFLLYGFQLLYLGLLASNVPGELLLLVPGVSQGDVRHRDGAPVGNHSVDESLV